MVLLAFGKKFVDKSSFLKKKNGLFFHKDLLLQVTAKKHIVLSQHFLFSQFVQFVSLYHNYVQAFDI